MTLPTRCRGCGNRRTFLADFGMGFAGLALGALLHRDGVTHASEATWARPAWTEWKVLPTLALGFGPNVAPGQ